MTGAPTFARRRALRDFDWPFFLSAILLLGVGLATLYSVSVSRDPQIFRSQVVKVAIGLVPAAVFLIVHPQTWRRAAGALYVLNLVLLLAVLLAGSTGGGAKRWVQLGPLEFQPSEMSKLLVAVTLAAFYAARYEHIKKLSTFGLGFLHILAPAVLVFKQPHLGATMVLIVIWLGISIVAGVPWKYIVTPVIAVIAVLAAGLAFPGLLLRPYQTERMMSMIKGDKRDDAYQAHRAQIAFGVGGVLGQGYLKGEQKQGGYVPEQHTDFIFTVVGEEGGFVGCVVVISLFGLFFFRGWLIMLKLADPFLKMVAAGLLAALAFHTVVNLYMNVQMLPVVGLWLPFFSYGGTAMWLCMSAVGLLLSLKLHEKPLLF